MQTDDPQPWSSSMTNTPDPRRARLPRALAGPMPAYGMRRASLRPRVAAAGASERMPICLFGSRDALVAEILQVIAADPAALLTERFQPAPGGGTGQFLRAAGAALSGAESRPALRIRREPASAAGREGGAAGAVAQARADGLLASVQGCLAAPDAAALAPTRLESLVVLQQTGHAATAARGPERLAARGGED